MRITRLAERPEQAAATQEDDASSTAMLPPIDLQATLQILMRQKKIIIAVIVGIMLLAYVVTSSLTPRYTASAFVEINARQARVVDFDAVLTDSAARFRRKSPRRCRRISACG